MRQVHVEQFKMGCIGLVNTINTCDQNEIEEIYKTKEFKLLLDALEEGIMWNVAFKDIDTEWEDKQWQ